MQEPDLDMKISHYICKAMPRDTLCRCRELTQAYKHLKSIYNKEVLDPVNRSQKSTPNPATKNLVDSLIKSIDSAKRVVEDLDKIPYWMQRLSILTESKV